MTCIFSLSYRKSATPRNTVPCNLLSEVPIDTHQKTSEKPLALDMGRKAAATTVALNQNP
ncbi:hypothetical protein QUA16_24465 [Microcoleus sp. S13_C3]